MKYTYIEKFIRHSSLQRIVWLGMIPVLGVLAALIVAWQSTRYTPLVDYSYQVEHAYRIFLGQIPYRDFFLVLPPGTYYILAALMYLTGGFFHPIQIIFTMLVAYCSLVLIDTLFRQFSLPIFFRFALLIPILFTGQAIYAFPSYDINTTVCILISLVCLTHTIQQKSSSVWLWAMCGISAALPIFFKQNTGIVYMLVVWVSILGVCTQYKLPKAARVFVTFSVGLLLPGVLYGVYLFQQGALHHFIAQTITFPRSSKNPFDGLAVILSEYMEVGHLAFQHWIYVWIVLAAFLLLRVSRITRETVRLSYMLQQFWARWGIAWCVAIFCFVVAAWYRSSRVEFMYFTVIKVLWVVVTTTSLALSVVTAAKTKGKNVWMVMFPWVIVATSHAMFLSHGVLGSSYGVWPLFILLVAYCLHCTVKRTSGGSVWSVFVASIFCSVIFFVAVHQNYFMMYVATTPGEVIHATHPRLYGLSTPGPWIKGMEKLFAYVDRHIPKDELIAFLPGEDPFYAVTGRQNPIVFTQLHPSTFSSDPYFIAQRIFEKNVQWVIIKKKTQVFYTIGLIRPDSIEILENELQKKFMLVASVDVYDIYRLTR